MTYCIVLFNSVVYVRVQFHTDYKPADVDVIRQTAVFVPSLVQLC